MMGGGGGGGGKGRERGRGKGEGNQKRYKLFGIFVSIVFLLLK